MVWELRVAISVEAESCAICLDFVPERQFQSAILDTFRCVFSYSKVNGILLRHLSISVPGGKYPNIFAAFTIAELFGFTGWDQKSEVPPADWFCLPNPDDICVVIAQELKDGESPT